MKISAVVAAVVAALSLAPSGADAQHLDLQMQNGLVTLQAQNVSVRQILAEWAKIGGTTIVNGEKVMGAPVTLQLDAVPERQALDVILRGVSGYMLASRQDPAPGMSAFDRILIMPTSTPPRMAPAPASAFTGRPAPRPMPQPEPVQSDEAVPDDDHDEPGEPEPVEVIEEEEPPAQPQPGFNPAFRRGPSFPNPMGGVQGQPFTPQALPGPEGDEEEAAPETTPSQGPLNVPPGASTMPGVIAPAPQQDEPSPSPRPRRPPR